MRLEEFQKKRSLRASHAPREFCLRCRHPRLTCLCALIAPFDPGVKFVILTHLREAQNRIGTGRLSHLNLLGSEFVVGGDYSANEKVNAILADPLHHCVILYPGADSFNLSSHSRTERRSFFPDGKKLVVFVIDGTWSTAPKILRQSANLHGLPRICFDPPAPSRFRIRKQPEAYCHSTIEAIHHTIDLFGTVAERRHDHLLRVFDQLVDRQIELSQRPKLYCLWSPRKKSKS